jgi:cell division transport system permease protein
MRVPDDAMPDYKMPARRRSWKERLASKPKTALPLSQDAAARFLPWLIGFMVFLAGLAMLGAALANNAASRWEAGLAGRLTVQIPREAEPSAGPAAGQAAGRLDNAVSVIIGTAGVRGAEVLQRPEVLEMLRPWLDDPDLAARLPLPDVIAVTLANPAEGAAAELAERLAAAVPEARVDDHQLWLSNVLSLTQSLELLALMVVALVGAAAAVSVVFVTRTGLSIHRQVIELLHLIGARDRYIARQFQNHALHLGLKGGLIGVALLVPAALATRLLLGETGREVLPFSLSLSDWVPLALLPPATALLAMVSARWTVLRTLSRLS